MTIQDLIKTLDKTKPDYVSIDDLAGEFELNGWRDWDTESMETRLKGWHHQDASWVCTDTMVGLELIYFDDELVCISTQDGRKCDKHYQWVSGEAYQKVLEFFLTEFKKTIKIPESVVDMNTSADSWIRNCEHNKEWWRRQRIKWLEEQKKSNTEFWKNWGQPELDKLNNETQKNQG